MARKAETGLQYFPINSDIINHPKMKLIAAQFGAAAWAVVIALFCKIYREKGYYIDWEDDEMRMLFALDECKCDLEFVEKVVSGCVKRRLFSEKLFKAYGILTSDRVQENFLEAKKRNKTVEMIKEFLLYDDNVYSSFENVTISPLTVNIITKNVDIGTQKEKEKEILKEEGEGDSAYTNEEKELFKNFQNYVNKNAQDVNRLKEPITIRQYLKLRNRIPKEDLMQLVKAMHNKKDLLSKYKNAYLTILAWRARDEKTNGNGHAPPEFDAREQDSREILNASRKK